ncbi:MAG: tRNA (guanosine(37)-N1)-methyltransferase TrmD [Firmicutes bacterium]|nr:tRNA (guanosine(37)-N1)-methyltransferase TrmD [Bacillota bacterium]
MKITVLTLFPEMFDSLRHSVIGRAIAGGIIEFNVRNIRDFSADKHFRCDDMPYGGGAGMVMTPQPIVSAFVAIDPEHKARRIYLSPKGRVLDQNLAKELAAEDELLLLCGHYEGIDQRALDITLCEEVSVGDYILTGGELPAMTLIDCVCRFVKGVLGSEESAGEESFSEDGLLEYPHYTRPQVFEGLEVPPVLISGHHANIKKWREKQATETTRKNRPDLLREDK